MNRDQISEALEEISDKHIAETAVPKKRFRFYKLGAIAAVVAAAVLIGIFFGPMSIQAKAVSVTQNPKESAYTNVTSYTPRLQNFFGSVISEFLSGTKGENTTFSPMNLYMGLAMLAQTTSGDSRQQILDLLNTTEADLIAQTNDLWNACYKTGTDPCTLANSLWLDSGITYNQAMMDTLAQDFHASVYQQDLSSGRAAADIRNWINNQTGGFLQSHAERVELPQDTHLVLASTIYFRAKWNDEFKSSNNKDGIFHSPGGDVECTFMTREQMQGYYYWGEDFGAITLGLENGARMWLILPDEDKTVDDVLQSSEYAQMLLDGEYENQKYMKINLDLPKFDISNRQDLKEGLMKLGITDVFDPLAADFSAALEDQTWLTMVDQSTRVAIDEQGVTAASYIEFPGAGAAQPPEEIIDFVLDRPFLFVVTMQNLPLFAGVVNNP